jgi:hypothetical protein
MIYKHSITTVTPSRPMSPAFINEAFGATPAVRLTAPATRP